MTIQNRFTLEPTHLVRAALSKIPVSLESTGSMKPHTIDHNEEWRLSATLEIRFWANESQLATTAKAAERALVHEIYSDVLSEFSRIRMALMGRDVEGALETLNRVDKFLTEARLVPQR